VPRVQRAADVTWEGNVARGSGTISAETGAFRDLGYSLPTRIGEAEGKTSPEELLAAAHAACYAMSLANELAQAGTPVEQLNITATVSLDEVEGGSHRIVSSELRARARGEGIELGALEQAAQAADEGCPLSALIRATATISVNVDLEGGANGD
jgi:lipoyl-dependent peroxiredoxin